MFCNYCHFQMGKWRHRIAKGLAEATYVVNIPGWDLNPGLPDSRGCVFNRSFILCPPQDDTKVYPECAGYMIIISFICIFIVLNFESW